LDTHETNGKDASGVLGAVHPDAAIDKPGRQALAVWRDKTAEGKVEMLEYLDTYRGGHDGFAQDLDYCLCSEDDRVALGALKLEIVLREWGGQGVASPSVHIGDVNQTLVQIPESWLKDPRLRDAALTLTERVIGGEKTNGQE